MSLSLLITINFLAGVALLSALTYAMSRATKLTPHVPARDEAPTASVGPPLTAPHHARVRSHNRAARASAPIAARS
jgi:hypothetical protein